MVTAEQCFAKAAEVLNSTLNHTVEARAIDAAIAKEWRQLGEAIASVAAIAGMQR